MANKQKRPKKFGLAGGKHGSKRKALGYGRKKYQYSCNLKETCVLLIKRKPIHRKNVKKVKSVKQLKKFYQIYRSAETGQLRKRYVKRLFHGKANGYRWVHKNTGKP